MKQEYIIDRIADESNCSTVIIGKDASVTGKVILGHNEDDPNAVVQLHIVPRVKHKEGETISFADGSAVIPQVEETYSYYWSEVRCKGGISFADGFVNEWGVAVVSNACRPSKVKEGDDSGIGYALRRLIAERARTAREGVEVAAGLVEKFGYFSARTYSIVDKNEAWVFQIPTGRNYVARKVGDDEIFYIPNWFTIHQVDFSDTEHKKFYFSKDLAKFAEENGWYTPKVAGDYSDFDFAAAYQDGEMAEYNILRARNAWRILTGVKPENDRLKPFSKKAERKYSADDIKKVLRSHYEGTEDDQTENYTRNPHRVGVSSLCNDTTIESSIIEFNEDIYLTRLLRASQKPCITPYTPWYPVALTKIPDGYSAMGYLPAQVSHFYVDDSELEYDPAKAWWAFRTLQYFTEFNYRDTHAALSQEVRAMEKDWEAEKAGIEKAYTELKETNLSAAREYLTSYTAAQAKKSWNWANKMIHKLGEEKILSNCKEWENK